MCLWVGGVAAALGASAGRCCTFSGLLTRFSDDLWVVATMFFSGQAFLHEAAESTAPVGGQRPAGLAVGVISAR